MKMRIVILPFLIFGLFAYGVAKLTQASENDTNPVDVPALVKNVKADAKHAKAEVQEVLKKGVPDYSVVNK